LLLVKEADSAGRAETRKGLTNRPQRSTRQALPPAGRHEEAPYWSHLTLFAFACPSRPRTRAPGDNVPRREDALMRVCPHVVVRLWPGKYW